MKKLLKNIFFTTILLGVFFLTPFSVQAETDAGKEVKAAVSVAALVPTKACAAYSSVTSNVSELLSDSSQKATITVKIEDCSEAPLADAWILLTSNRGAIDKINLVDSDGNILMAGDGLGVNGQTDANGYVFYQVFSGVPGESIFNARVDEQLDVGQAKITFLPLPFPKNISVVIEVPKIISPTGQITIFKPKNFDIDKDKLVNMTMELRIPSWVFYVTIFVIFANFIMFLTILYLSYRIRKLQKQELGKIEETAELVKKEETEIEEIAEKNN